MKTRDFITKAMPRVAALAVLLSGGLPCQASVRPLAVHPANPHYLLFRGKPVVLITSGEHYGAVLNLDFNYRRYLDELHAHRLSHTRLFSGTYREVPPSFGITDNTLAPKPNRYLAPWSRSTTPGYFDGGNKFDLTRWDEDYFRRLKDFVREAGKRGIVVEISLFCPLYDEALWRANPMNATNNINRVGDCPLNEVYTLKHPDLTCTQKDVTRKIVQELNHFDNLYYEICNEPWVGNVTSEWQNEIVATIVETEVVFPARHLISLNYWKLRILDPHPDVAIYNFHHPDIADAVSQNYALNRVIGDNETGFRGRDNLPYRTEAWDCILSGGGLFSSLDYSFTPRHPDGTLVDYKSPGGGNREFRRQLRVLKEFIHSFDFVRMEPHTPVVRGNLPPGLAAPRVLAELGRAYAIYLRRRTDADKFSVRWTGSITPPRDEPLNLYTVSNDGVRLWVDDKLLIDNSRDHALREDNASLEVQAGHKLKVRLEIYNLGGDSVSRLLWSRPGFNKEVIAASSLTAPDGKPGGLRGEYFHDRKMTKLSLSRHDSTVDFDWRKVTPFPTERLGKPIDVRLDLPSGNYRAEWLEPRSGNIPAAERFQHTGGEKVLVAPGFSEDIVLKLTRRR